jgi:hypothetical protein
MTAITLAIRDDIRSQPDAFELLDAATSSPGQLTQVRLLWQVPDSRTTSF